MTNEKNCILATACNKAGVEDDCSRFCPHYIQLHGANGLGGRVARANIPKQYRNITLANSPVEESQPEVYAKVEHYVASFWKMFADDLSENNRIKSLYLYSEATGTGKTTTAVAIAHEYLKRHYIGCLKRGIKPNNQPVFFVGMNELQTLYNEANRPNVPREMAEAASLRYYEYLQTMKNVDFLVFDDLGLRSASESFTSDIHNVINHRNTMMLPTVYTSNIPLKDIGDIYSKQIWDRVRDMCMEIPFKGESKRGFRR